MEEKREGERQAGREIRRERGNYMSSSLNGNTIPDSH